MKNMLKKIAVVVIIGLMIFGMSMALNNNLKTFNQYATSTSVEIDPGAANFH